MHALQFPDYDGLGQPAHWRKETSGRLAVAVHAFFFATAHGGEQMSAELFNIIRRYGEYVVNAPSWEPACQRWRLDDCRQQIAKAENVSDVVEWLEQCKALNIEPF